MQPKEVSHQLLEWQFTFHESGLASSEQIDHISQECTLFRPPNIIFSNNQMIIRHTCGFSLIYNARQALRYINFETRKQRYCELGGETRIDSICYLPEKLQIRHAEKWKHIELPKNVEISEIHQTSDSFFLTPFKGLIEGKAKVEHTAEGVIPLQKLGPQNEMKFYQQGSFYEDELDDNGLIQYEYKFRAMGSSWFALLRCYARVDEVSVQVMDTRVYWEQGWEKIARQFMVKKSAWDELKESGFDLGNGFTMNPNQSHLIYASLKEIFVSNEYIHFK